MNATFGKGVLVLAVSLGTFVANTASAQMYHSQPTYNPGSYGYGYDLGYNFGGYGPATVAESYYRGYADLARASGESNYYNALAQVQWEQAREKQIVNHQAGVQAYFSLRKFNQEQRFAAIAARRPSKEQLAAMSKKAAPKRLNEEHWNAANDGLTWPTVLDRSEFSHARNRLDELFRMRRDAASGLSGDDYREAQELANAMTAELKDLITEVTPGEYAAAKSFLKSVAYEAKFAPTGERLVQN